MLFYAAVYEKILRTACSTIVWDYTLLRGPLHSRDPSNLPYGAGYGNPK